LKKAKTRKNIFSILSAVLGVVFALITGATYCASSINVFYITNQNNVDAYLGNNEYVMINDTQNNPIYYGEGTHNFEIAMQYSVSYDFDVRLKYNLKWIDYENNREFDAENVILNFVNRDNIICDEEYIFLANPISAGNGKITFISGVDFVDTNDPAYYGKTLKINIVDDRIYKAKTEYDDDHPLYKDATYTQGGAQSYASQLWLAHKPKTEEYSQGLDQTQTNIMMYNYRRGYSYGVPYIGNKTAYKRTITTNGETEKTTSATWLGGNRAYAGAGIYVVTGTKPIKITVTVKGAWYSGEGEIDTSDSISENSITYNYAQDWTHKEWVDNKLWETRTFDYVIPENSAHFVNILDNVEITSATKNPDTVEFDKYRLVTNVIDISVGGKTETFDYSVKPDYIRKATLAVGATTPTGDEYVSKSVDVVNTSIFSNGLYETSSALVTSEQTFNTNVCLINNTSNALSVTLTYQLYYYIRNGATNFKGAADIFLGLRGEEIASQYSIVDAFGSNVSYGYSETTSRLSSSVKTTVTIAPYSTIKLLDYYKVSASLQTDIDIVDGNVITNYDVWTYLDVKVAQQAGVDKIETATNPSTDNLAIETTSNGTNVSLSVKNNTPYAVTGITISSFSIEEMISVGGDDVATDSSHYDALTQKPSDWNASFWKYYKIVDGKYVQLTYDPLASNADPNYFPYSPTNPALNYYEKDQQYYSSNTDVILFVVNDNIFTKSGSTITNKSDITLQPGESVVFGTATTSQTNHINVKGVATATTIEQPSSVAIVNNGTADAYIVNNTSNSYYLRMAASEGVSQDNFELGSSIINEVSSTHYYYIGIVRPGQIIKVSMTTNATITSDDLVVASNEFDIEALEEKDWSEQIINLLTSYFVKPEQTEI